MMTLLIVLATAAEAYLLGSIDTGILVSKYLYHDDVRNYGSGAAGITNMLRTFGKKAAALTAFGDVLKGALAVCIGRWLFGYLPAGGAVSPYLGVYLAAIQPILIPFLFLIFLACLLPTGMVSLGSITMAALYPVLTLIYSYYRGLAAGDMAVCFVGALIMSILVIYMHRSNIKRIREGKEYRFGKKHQK